MTPEEIIEMADKCGLLVTQQLKAFAKLVTEKALIEQGYRKCAEGQKTTQFCALLEQAVLEEREACAKVCEEREQAWRKAGLWGKHPEYEECAIAIRARGKA
jgi:hypothetical protein